MSRLVFICPYRKPGNGPRRQNLVRYMATREGVQLTDLTEAELPATDKQRSLIQKLVKETPETADLMEYEDFQCLPTRGRADAFIQAGIEQAELRFDERKNFVDYMANRPKVQRVGKHGLFSSGSEPLVLDQVMREVAEHPGNVWTPVISLHREDAVKLGYIKASDWQALLNIVMPEIAESMKIHPDHLRWYAAFHDADTHPHIHMVLYSTDPTEGFLTKQGIQKIKSALANEIFRPELLEMYELQTAHRNETAEQSRAAMVTLIEQLESGTLQNPRMEELLLALSEKLRELTGKKQYGYLPPRVKRIVDAVVDELQKDPRIAAAYDLWYQQREHLLELYHKDLPERLPLSQQKEFKHIRNMVIQEAMKLQIPAPTAQAVNESPAGNSAVPSAPAVNPPNSPNSQSELRADPSAALSAASKLLRHMGQIFRDQLSKTGDSGLHQDQKQRREEQEKRLALGHREDDHADPLDLIR